MSLLINDELIWISIPRCASNSIEDSLLSSNLKIKKSIFYSELRIHPHVFLDDLYDEFGKKETFCIKRDWLDRWLSALQYILERIEKRKIYTPSITWSEIDNNFIYKTFDNNFIYNLYSYDKDLWKKTFAKSFLKNDFFEIIDLEHERLCALLPQNGWKNNVKCTYEFDIKEIHLFSEFIEEKYQEKITIKKLQETTKQKSKLIIDEKLKNFIYDNFETPLIKVNKTLL